MFGQEIKESRILNGSTQTQVAKATGLPQATISWIELDKGIPNIMQCVKLADYYEIELDELIGRDKEEYRKYTSDGVFDTKKIGTAPTVILTAEERALIENFRTLSPLLKNTTLETVRTWAGKKSSHIDLHNNT